MVTFALDHHLCTYVKDKGGNIVHQKTNFVSNDLDLDLIIIFARQMTKIREIRELIRVLSCPLKKTFGQRWSLPYFTFGIQMSNIRKGNSGELCTRHVLVSRRLVDKLSFVNSKLTSSTVTFCSSFSITMMLTRRYFFANLCSAAW